MCNTVEAADGEDETGTPSCGRPAGPARLCTTAATATVVTMFPDSSWPHELRRQQAAALRALDDRWTQGATRAWVALPPGAGKTVLGLEAARRLQRRTVVFGPNTAIQQQWLASAAAYRPEPLRAGRDRVLDEPLTVLTYQSLATFDPEAEVDEEGAEKGTGKLVDRLHSNGRALVANLRSAGPLTLILDECHHLLEVWGRLLAELLESLPDAVVLGLTATPPSTLTPQQAELVDRLFGEPAYTTSIPAVVRDGHLAPFAELAWLTSPTTTEAQWLREQATRFAELTSDLDHPDFATVPLWQWLDFRFITRTTVSGAPISWARFEKERPDLATAILRFSCAGKLRLPEGATVREEHRVDPTADDWVAIIDDYVSGFLSSSDAPIDAASYQRLRVALPAIGWTLTKNGIRAGRSPIDRVLARSEAKTRAVVDIATAELSNLGERARILVLADHQRATATLPATLVGVLGREAGSATLVLEQLCSDPEAALLNPVLVTGTTVSCANGTAAHLLAYLRTASEKNLITERGEAHGTVEIVGPWGPRHWVPLLTAYLAQGHTRMLIGTRALLGEGWDAPCVNTLIDLTTSTTATSVVQTRGRALRIDPAWPEKVANTWSVVCVSDEHPKGSADWSRLSRKHAGFLALDSRGEISDGVTHLNPSFSPYQPPGVEEFDQLNAGALSRSQRRDEVRAGWQVGTPYDDVLTTGVHIRSISRRPHAKAELSSSSSAPPLIVSAEHGAVRTQRERRGTSQHNWRDPPPAAVVAASAVTAAGLASTVGGEFFAAAAAVAVAASGAAWDIAVSAKSGQLLDEARTEPDLFAYGSAVAEALAGAGLIAGNKDSPTASGDTSLITSSVDHRGIYRVALRDALSGDSEIFAAALDEVLSPIGSPRYLVPRYLLAPRRPGKWGRHVAGWRWRHGRAPGNAVIYHAVPTMLGANAKRARLFAAAWSRWVSAGEPIYANSPAGEGVLATHRGRSPLDVTTALRVSWH